MYDLAMHVIFRPWPPRVWTLLAALQLLSPLGASADLPVDKIHLPPGFHIEVFAYPLKGARSMAQAPGGILFVGTRDHGDGQVYALETRTKPPTVHVIARDLDEPNGVAFRDGSLYVAEVSRILRYDHILDSLDHPPRPVALKQTFPKDHWHGWKFIRFGPDGKLYVPVGAPCNECERPDPFASITRMNPDGTAFEIFARGIRNTVGFDWDPRTRELWFTDNGRDYLGDDAPPDELNHAPKSGINFGFPYCHGGDIADPDFGFKHPCQEFTPPAQKLGPHAASLGMRFYTGEMFPADYRRQMFIAEHGSWNRSRKIGYRVTVVRLEEGNAVSYTPFAEGWKQGESCWGRPVDVEVWTDGSLLVSDDYAGAIYRITYAPR